MKTNQAALSQKTEPLLHAKKGAAAIAAAPLSLTTETGKTLL